MAGWLEIWRVKLISTQVAVEVKVGVESGNILYSITVHIIIMYHIIMYNTIDVYKRCNDK